MISPMQIPEKHHPLRVFISADPTHRHALQQGGVDAHLHPAAESSVRAGDFRLARGLLGQHGDFGGRVCLLLGELGLEEASKSLRRPQPRHPYTSSVHGVFVRSAQNNNEQQHEEHQQQAY